MKTVNVVAAIIIHNNQVFATQRGYGDFKGGWEFPGGKIEENETPEEALVREIKEELEMDIEVGKLLDIVEYDYPKFHLTMKCYVCKMKNSKFILNEHEDARWLDSKNLYSVEWLPADLVLIDQILSVL